MAVVSWTPETLDPIINEEVQLMMDETGNSIIGLASPPVDTGFLMASAYLESPGESSYGNTWTTGSYPDRNGQMVQRFQTPLVSPVGEPPHGIVGWAAEHALAIEETQPFIYIALMSAVDGGFGGDTATGDGSTSAGESEPERISRESSDGGLFSLSWA